jgi:prepilin-type N-terminal cleavage/methylation domain-containing protein
MGSFKQGRMKNPISCRVSSIFASRLDKRFWLNRRNAQTPNRSGAQHRHVTSSAHAQGTDGGFTLVELLIVTTILPLVVGALSLSLIAVFSLQSNATNRLTDTADAQTVAADFTKDIQAAVYITTDATSSPQCGAGTGTQLLGMESVLNQRTGNFQTVVSYVSVPVTSGAKTTYSLERLNCVNGTTTPASVTTLAYDLPNITNSATAVTILCEASASTTGCSNTTQQWTQGYVSAAQISTVTFNVTAPTTSFNYDLVASPAVSSSFSSGGAALPSAAVCEPTQSSTGPYAGQLCFIDFSSLTNADLKIAATANQCFNMSVSVLDAYLLHFCLSYSSSSSSEGLVPTAFPTDTDAGLGQSVYPGIGGDPSLYMSPYIGSSTTMQVNLTSIYVVNASTGLRATGWSLVGADAETTNVGETLTWTSDVPLTVLNDFKSGATQSPAGNPAGNACDPTGSGTLTVTCVGVNTPSPNPVFTGAAMVAATTPSYMTVNANNYEAFSFGMLLP